MDEILEVNSIFEQPWWLNLVAPGKWQEVLLYNGSKEIIGRLPFVYHQKRLGNYIGNPILTPFLGPWLRITSDKESTRIAQEKDILSQLISQLPPFDSFGMSFHPRFQNWLPFYWEKFTQTTYYTYCLESLSDLENVWNNLTVRTDIRKAEKKVEIKTTSSSKLLYDIWSKTYQRQNLLPPVSYEIIDKIVQEIFKRNCGQIFYAEDQQNCIHCAAFIIWDKHCAYYLIGGGDPEYRNSGATSYMIWEAIKHVSSFVNKFDFEGSMIEPIERFFRAFGGTQTPYFHVTKYSRKFKILKNIKNTYNLIRNHD
jgi:hypothetical protein